MKGLTFNQRLSLFVVFLIFLIILAIIGMQVFQGLFINYGMEELGIMPEEGIFNEVVMQ